MLKPQPAGKRSKVITIQGPLESVNSFGEIVRAWVDIITLRADIRQINGNEKTASAQVVAEYEYAIETCYRSDITAENRVAHNGLTYEITRVENVQNANRTLILYCGLVENQESADDDGSELILVDDMVVIL